MATVSVTNQTLTMTIDIDGIETVIRKDNCKVQSFGQMVRITDYKGSIYEFLYSDCTAPSEPNANDLRDAIEAFLNTGGGGGGGGITTITSTDGSITIDNTDPSAPDLSIPNGTWTPTFSTFVDAITAATLFSATYLRVGNIVTCSITLTIEVDFSSVNIGSVQFTLPFSTTTGGACGSLSSSNITKQFNGAVRSAGTTLGRIVMASEDTSLVTSSASCHVLFQYEVN